MVEITYSSKKLEKILSDEKPINKEYGKMAQGVRNRMSELRAATSLKDIPVPSLTHLVHNPR